MDKFEDLEKRIHIIEQRNRSVELNKSWEQSFTRRILIFAFTYLAIALYLKFVVGINPWINAIVPSIGFVLSTLTLPWFKRQWAKYLYKKWL
jgi:hypothetical protein